MHILSCFRKVPLAVLQFVFGTCAAGAVVLTVNVVLLGGNIGFFQSMCLLGYCLFPMDIAAIVTALTTNMIARWIVVLVRPQPSQCPFEALANGERPLLGGDQAQQHFDALLHLCIGEHAQ